MLNTDFVNYIYFYLRYDNILRQDTLNITVPTLRREFGCRDIELFFRI